MSGRTILKIESPKTQTVEAVKALLSWKHHPVNPLPCDVSLENDRLVLVLSNKKDCFYVTTSRACSCPAHNWHPGQRCKHQRKYFPEVKAARPAVVEARKPFRPFVEDEARPAKAAAASSIPLVDTLGEPTPGEPAYHSIKADREFWPCEA